MRILELFPEPVAMAIMLVVWAVWGAVHAGCTGALPVAATALTETRALRVQFYRDLDARCQAEPSLDRWRSCMAPAYGLAHAADGFAAALRAADGQGGCAVEAANRFADALAEVGLTVPPGIRELAAGVCR